MRIPTPFLRVAPIISSVLLVGGLVAHRAGAFGWGPYAPSPPKSPTPGGFDRPVPARYWTTQDIEVYTSKSKMVFDPLKLPNGTPATPATRPFIMSSSKTTFTPVLDPSVFQPAANTPAPAPNAPPTK